MSAETLRKAAETLREQAKRAQRGPWEAVEGATGRWWVERQNTFDVCFDLIQDDATYIALMHPGVGLALADWLEFVWSMGEPGRKNGLTGEAYDTGQALAVARLILGGDS